jgi:hypothetical protein
MTAELTKVWPLLKTMKVRLPGDYASIVDGYYDSYVDGQTETEIIAATRSKLLTVVAANQPLADDDVLVDVGKLLAEQYAALRAKDPTLCYAAQAGHTRDFSSDIPTPLIQRQTFLEERIIATAEKRPDISDQMTAPLREKVGKQLAKRIGAEKIKLLQEPNPDPSKHKDICDASIALFQEITNLTQKEAGLLLRQIFTGRFMPASSEEVPQAVEFALSGDMRWIVYASRQDMEEAIGQARYYSQEAYPTRVMRSVNGWYAVVAGPAHVPSPAAFKKQLLQSWQAPKDVIFSKGKSYIEQVWLAPKSPHAPVR